MTRRAFILQRMNCSVKIPLPLSDTTFVIKYRTSARKALQCHERVPYSIFKSDNAADVFGRMLSNASFHLYRLPLQRIFSVIRSPSNRLIDRKQTKGLINKDFDLDLQPHSPLGLFHDSMATSAAAGLLGRQLKQMQTDKDIPGISCGLVDNNVMEWEVMLMISDDCKYYGGGFFRAHLTFPPQYPLLPPKMTFQTPIFHPNIYAGNERNGEVCISILHPPEEDKYGYESVAERWSPVQTPETILLSVISMLSSPNDESPANVEAARMWREDEKGFRRKCRANVRASLGED